MVGVQCSLLKWHNKYVYVDVDVRRTEHLISVCMLGDSNPRLVDECGKRELDRWPRRGVDRSRSAFFLSAPRSFLFVGLKEMHEGSAVCEETMDAHFMLEYIS